MPEHEIQLALAKDRDILIQILRHCNSHINWSDYDSMYGFREALQSIIEDDKGHYLSLSQEQPKKISYASVIEHKFDNVKRTRSSIGRYLKRNYSKFSSNVTDEEMRNLTNIWGRMVSNMKNGVESLVKIIHGNKITRAYGKRIGCGSCMTGEDASLVILYEMNPEKVGMLIFGEDEARAILWETDQGDKVLDRIYPNDGYHIDVIRDWCELKGIKMRSHQGYPESDHILFDGEKEYTVTLDIGEVEDVYPYMDSFCYGDFDRDNDLVILSNKRDPKEIYYSFFSTGGSYSGGCGECETVPARMVSGHGVFCDTCYESLFIECDCCDTIYNRSRGYTVYNNGVRERWCHSCVLHAPQCDGCHIRLSNSNELTGIRDCGTSLCIRCLCDSRDIVQCGVCNSWFGRIGNHHIDHINNRVVCINCGTRCDECGDWMQGRRWSNNTCDTCHTNIYNDTVLEV